MNIRTELLEALVRQCVREVLDQVDEKSAPDQYKKLKVKWGKSTKFPVKPKTVKEAEEEDPNKPKEVPTANKPAQPPFQTPAEPTEPSASAPQQAPAAEPSAKSQPPTSQPEKPVAEPSKEPQEPEKPEEPETRRAFLKGAIIVNPKDKSKMDSLTLKSLSGQNDANIERILHQVAVKNAGARAKVSLGAKRLAREISKNPSVTAYFYFGKLDPDSEEIFLMADKSIQVAKDASVQPGEITGTPASTLPPNYKIGGMNDAEYMKYLGTRNAPTPRYGIDEGAKKMIKTMVNQILDGKK